jgi:hypothetical protein
LLFGVSIALLGRGDEARVDQLPGHGEVALGPELLVEPGEQGIDRAGLGQRLAEGPERVRIRHRIAQPEAEEAHPGQPVAQVELGALVGQAVLGLQDQDLELQHVVERRPPALRPIGPRHRPLELGPEHFEVDHACQPFEAVALLRQSCQPLLDIEKAGRTPHSDPPQLRATVDQIAPPSPRFLEVSTCICR